MFTIAVIGHSLVPTTVTLTDLNDMTIDMYCFSGATIDSLTHQLNQSNLWDKTYDLIILCIGGNDLVRNAISNVFDIFCNLVRRLLQRTTKLSACTIEYRLYQKGNRFMGRQRHVTTESDENQSQNLTILDKGRSQILRLGEIRFHTQQNQQQSTFQFICRSKIL